MRVKVRGEIKKYVIKKDGAEIVIKIGEPDRPELLFHMITAEREVSITIDTPQQTLEEVEGN